VLLRLPRALLATLLLLLLASSALATGSRGVRFRTIAEGFAEARDSGKPLLLFFTAEWCPPCHSLELEFFASSHFAKGIEKDYVPVRVVDRTREEGRNAPEVQELITSANVTGFPTLVVVRPDGKAAVRSVGYSSRSATLSFLREAPSRLERAERRKRPPA
jgi:protein disulfide-isomerase